MTSGSKLNGLLTYEQYQHLCTYTKNALVSKKKYISILCVYLYLLFALQLLLTPLYLNYEFHWFCLYARIVLWCLHDIFSQIACMPAVKSMLQRCRNCTWFRTSTTTRWKLRAPVPLCSGCCSRTWLGLCRCLWYVKKFWRWRMVTIVYNYRCVVVTNKYTKHMRIFLG